MFLLVDAVSLASDPELPHLLSFGQVEDLTVEQHIELIERPDQESFAVLGPAGTRHVLLAPLNQFKRLADGIAARPACRFTADVIARALAFSFLADRLGADAVVSPAQSAFGPTDHGLLGAPIRTVAEALAMLGAQVRQRDKVPLGGSPLLVQERTEVYPLTARVIIPRGQEWWSSCVRTAGPHQTEWLAHAEAVFKRVGQALGGRDGVHEALRMAAGRSAILDALYHFDVVLTSGVGGLDALARVAHETFGMTSDVREAGWQREKKWRRKLKQIAPSVAGVVAPGTRLGAELRILTETRNSIHSIPLKEYLHVSADQHTSRVEHRVMIAADLGRRLRDAAVPLAPLDQHGVFLDDGGAPFLNVGEFTERLLSWTIEIIGEILGAMLSCSQFVAGTTVQLGPLERLERQYCAALARVGQYPCRTGAEGLPAAPSLHRAVMASLHRNQNR